MVLQQDALRYRSNWSDQYQRKIVSGRRSGPGGPSPADFVVTPLPEQPSFLMEAPGRAGFGVEKMVTVSNAAPAVGPGMAVTGHGRLLSGDHRAVYRFEGQTGSGMKKRLSYLPDLFFHAIQGIG